MIRGLIAFSVSLVVGVVLYPKVITFLQSINFRQNPSEYSLDEYKEKKNVVTFGGAVFVLIPIVVSVVMGGFSQTSDVILILLVFFGYGLIGFIDDYKIVTEGRNDGLKPRTKFMAQLVLALAFYALYVYFGGSSSLAIPFVEWRLELGFLYAFLVIFMLSGASNAVNLTDGMDGLASGTMILALIPYAFFAYMSGRYDIMLFILSLLGSLLAFLLYNKSPASIFMGDVGSLALGAVLAALAIILDKELLLIIIGGVFVFETACVIIQRISWKMRKKRVFKYTPIHYSFILNGWKESSVVFFFWMIGFALMIIGFTLGAF